MKLAAIVLASTFLVGNAFAAETQKVCHEKDVKGKKVQVCKDVKVHKKLDATKIPDKKK